MIYQRVKLPVVEFHTVHLERENQLIMLQVFKLSLFNTLRLHAVLSSFRDAMVIYVTLNFARVSF